MAEFGLVSVTSPAEVREKALSVYGDLLEEVNTLKRTLAEKEQQLENARKSYIALLPKPVLSDLQERFNGM